MTIPDITSRKYIHTAGAARLLGMVDGGGTPDRLRRMGMQHAVEVKCGGRSSLFWKRSDVTRARREDRLRREDEGRARLNAGKQGELFKGGE